MPVSTDNVKKSLRKLRKSLKKFPRDSSAEDVHKLRTQARRLEAVVAALMPHERKGAHRLLKAVKPVRKCAGEVRDMDVLEEKALTLAKEKKNDSLVRLMEHLGGTRLENSHDLYAQVAKSRKELRHSLKGLSRRIADEFDDPKHGSMGSGTNGRAGADAVAVALKLAEELSRWPELDAENIHAFRIKAKELRYVLQLAEDSNTRFTEVLEEVKDTIGDWHDWVELSKIAADVLDRDVDGDVLKQIEAVERRKFKGALAVANRLRKNYLGGAAGTKKAPTSAAVNREVLKAANRLAG